MIPRFLSSIARSLVCVLLLACRIHAAEEEFVEPNSEQWARMSAAEQAALKPKIDALRARLSAAAARQEEDQKSGLCHVHQVKMTPKVVAIEYGLPRMRDNENPIPPAVWSKLTMAGLEVFPNSVESRQGGCVVMSNSPKTATLYLCPECLTAKQRMYRELGLVK